MRTGTKMWVRLAVHMVLLAVFVGGGCVCGGKPVIKPDSELDTPAGHYRQGMGYLTKGNLDAATREFERSRGLDPKYAPAYEGLGLVALGRGNLDQAEQWIRDAKDKDGKYAPAYVGLGRIRMAQGKYEDAIGRFREATEADKTHRSVDAYRYMGQAYVKLGKYGQAEEAYRQGREAYPDDTSIDQAWTDLSHLKIAQAGTPAEYRAIARSAGVTRAEAAALFVSELPLEQIYTGKAPSRPAEFQTPEEYTQGPPGQKEGRPSDLEGHWARPYIEKALNWGVMGLRTGGGFHPDEKITRADFALLIQGVLVRALNDPALSTRFIGNVSAFSDVPEGHYAFNAVSLIASRGIMQGRPDGTFGLTDPIPGSEALLVVRTLREQVP